MKKQHWTYFGCWLALLLASCVKPYEPPATGQDLNLLVVDGFINSGSGATTTLVLSRSRKLSDTIETRPETGAQVWIEEGPGSFPLQETANGSYTSLPLTLNSNSHYRISITTADNAQYVSDYVPVKQTPTIDSLNWRQENDVRVYVSTHDPQNNTRYYRWDYTETWEYESFYGSYLEYRNGQVVFRDPADYQKVCWSTEHSPAILIGSSVSLSNDVIYQTPIAFIAQGSGKIGVKYSILVRQYALTEPAFNYWKILQKNTEQQGGLFDAQPSQLAGNIHCVSDPQKIAIGFISASTVEEKRIFISRSQLTNWVTTDPGPACDPQFISPFDASNYLRDGVYAPAYFVTGGGLAIAAKECVDCTSKGGTNKKPSFWQ